MSDEERAEIRRVSDALIDLAEEVHAQSARLTVVEERGRDRADTLARVEATQREHASRSEASFARLAEQSTKLAEQLARIEAAAAQQRQPWSGRDWAILIAALVPLLGIVAGLGYQVDATARGATALGEPMPTHDRVTP